jgi:hypothetical protein
MQQNQNNNIFNIRILKSLHNNLQRYCQQYLPKNPTNYKSPVFTGACSPGAPLCPSSRRRGRLPGSRPGWKREFGRTPVRTKGSPASSTPHASHLHSIPFLLSFSLSLSGIDGKEQGGLAEEEQGEEDPGRSKARLAGEEQREARWWRVGQRAPVSCRWELGRRLRNMRSR